MSSKPSHEYVLSTSTPEDARLKRQHDLWLDHARSLWRQARFSREHSILELGCGPGYSTLDLARYLGFSSQITAIELSPNFAAKASERMKDYPNVKVLNADLLEIDLGIETHDAVYGRWIWMFLPDIEKVLKKIIRSLKPGGVLTFQEYVDYGSISLSPHVDIQDTVHQAITKSFKDAGGEPDVVKKLLPLVETHGLQIELLEAHGKLIRPSDPFWDWPTQWYETYLPLLQSKGYLTEHEVKSFETTWKKAATSPGSFWIGPTVSSVIARKV